MALYPSKETINALTGLQGAIQLPPDAELTPPEEFHCTLRYFKTDDEELVSNILGWLQVDKVLDLMGNSGIMTGVSGIEQFGDDAIVAKLYSETLMTFQQAIDGALQKLGAGKSNFPRYRPHITLAYGKAPDINEKAPDLKIIFNRIAFVNNDSPLWEKQI